MAYIVANDLGVVGAQGEAEPKRSVSQVDLAPSSGDATPQTHAMASLTG